MIFLIGGVAYRLATSAARNLVLRKDAMQLNLFGEPELVKPTSKARKRSKLLEQLSPPTEVKPKNSASTLQPKKRGKRDGERKTKNGVTYELRNSRWVRVKDEEQPSNTVAGLKVIEPVQNLQTKQEAEKPDPIPASLPAELKGLADQYGNYIPLYEVRSLPSMQGLSRGEQDAAIFALERSEQVDTSTLNHPDRYSEEQRSAGIPNYIGGDTFFVSLRGHESKPGDRRVAQLADVLNENGVNAKVLAGGSGVQLSDKFGTDLGSIEIGEDGQPVDHTRLRPNHPILQAAESALDQPLGLNPRNGFYSEGDRKTVNGRTYELRNSRWHRVDDDATDAQESSKLDEPLIEDTYAEEAEQAPSEVGDTGGLGGREYHDAGDDAGASDSASDRGGDREIATPRIVTSRSDLTATADPEKVPARLREHLREHQIQGAALAIQAMDTQGGFLLADGTGAGKSRQLLAIAQAYADQGKKVLIVAPSQVIKQNWKKGTFEGSYAKDGEAMGVQVALTRDGKDLTSGQISITTYDALSKVKDGVDGDTVLLWDEAHYMKNADSARSKHGIEMCKRAHSVCYATATPADKPEHIPYLFRTQIFKGHKKEAVYNWLGLRSREVGIAGGKTVTVWEVPRGKAAEVHHRFQGLFDDLTERGLMVQRGISMDGVNVEFQTIPLPDGTQEILDSIAKAYNYGEKGGLEKAQMLMQQRRQLEPFKIPAAVDEVKKELDKGNQVVLFVSRVSESEVTNKDDERVVASEGTAGTLKRALLEAGITDVAELHGGADTKAADSMKAFQSGDSRVIIATIESGGTGVNLDDTTGDRPRTLLMLTPPFSAVENIQAAGRVWRMTTRSYPTVRYLFTDTSVDEWNREIISNKMAAVGAAVPGIDVLDLPYDISDEGLEAFLEARKQGTLPTGPAPRLPDAPKGPPPGFRTNKYAGYAPDGTFVPANTGYIRQENGRWVTYAKNHVSDDGKILLRIEKPKALSTTERLSRAKTVLSKLKNLESITAKPWQGGDKIRIYLNQPGSYNGYGYLDVLPDGRIRNQSTLPADHPVIQAIADDLAKSLTVPIKQNPAKLLLGGVAYLLGARRGRPVLFRADLVSC